MRQVLITDVFIPQKKKPIVQIASKTKSRIEGLIFAYSYNRRKGHGILKAQEVPAIADRLKKKTTLQ